MIASGSIRRALILCFPFFVLDGIVFAWYLIHVGWMVDRHGVPPLHDFVSLWIAGRHASHAYDLASTEAAQAALTHVVGQYEPYNYPPHFLLALIPLTRLPYAIAFASFVLITASLYAWSVAAIAGRREAAVCALAMPGFVPCLLLGQTGFLAAALAGLTLLVAEKRPALAGLALAGLTFKPQFGPLFPLALVLERRWIALAVAAGTTAVALGFSFWLFGPGVFVSFFAAIERDVDSGLGRDTLLKMHSIYGAARLAGASAAVAWAAQGFAMLGCIAAVSFVHWRCQLQSLRNATLLACAPLFTPHVLIYDLVIVSPAVAFLWRDKPLRPLEWALLIAAGAATCVFFFAPAPVGAIMPLAALGLALARAFEQPAAVTACRAARIPAESIA